MQQTLTSFLLRVGLAIGFLYAAIASFINPAIWESFVPQYVTILMPATLFVILFSILQIILALWLLSNKHIYYAGIVSATFMFLILVGNYHSLDLVFRDIPILFAGLALVALHKQKKSNS